MPKKVTSTMAVGLVPGKIRVKTTVVPSGTIVNDIRPADTFKKTPPASWGKRQPARGAT